jgi:hypothetical protein
MTEDDFLRSQHLFRDDGFAVGESWYDGRAFGSWCIELTKDGFPKQGVVWDGKDGWLIVQALASSGSWLDKWVGRKKSEQSPEAALAELNRPVTREWELKVERERAQSWANFQLEQALSTAGRLWDAGCYSDYVRELTPFRDQLSPAQLKRLEIAQDRSSAS